tara:strand:- start:801 stop:1337 length:537 start_codon:yes stop_codon:yes gene_type:complete
MSTTQKMAIKGLTIDMETQFDLLADAVTELVGEAGKVTVKEKGSKGLRMQSRDHIAANSKFADIKIRFHGSDSDVGVYVDDGGQVQLAWDSYVVRGNQQLKDTFEGRSDRNTFEKNLNAMVVAKTLEQAAIERGMVSLGVKRVSKTKTSGQFEVTIQTGSLGMEKKDKNKLGGSLGGF